MKPPTHRYALSDFDFTLPQELIAQHPAQPRDHSRLLVVNRATGTLEHKLFYEITNYLQPGDVLVRNVSKVINARLHGTKPTGGKIEVFLLRNIADKNSNGNTWECLIKGKIYTPLTLQFSQGFTGTVTKHFSERTWNIVFNKPGITTIGEIPLPPYITEPSRAGQYQTVYADESNEGSVAAPTAGLHFTPELITQLQHNGVTQADVILHVGLGTFAPVKTNDLSKHSMHSEYAILPEVTAHAIADAHAARHKVWAVGTTSVRTLEAFSGAPAADWTNIFITPGYKFKIVDGMLTNFHLPKSTLLMLVSAFAGKNLIDYAYQEAIKHKYRFYSFGDAMLIV